MRETESADSLKMAHSRRVACKSKIREPIFKNLNCALDCELARRWFVFAVAYKTLGATRASVKHARISMEGHLE
jgi:hypothetical protein